MLGVPRLLLMYSTEASVPASSGWVQREHATVLASVSRMTRPGG